MEHIRFGSTGIKVSPLAFGTMTVGDALDEAAAFDVFDLCVEHGVNFIDTANTYVGGRSEEIVGRWMKARGCRERIVLATKVRYPVGGDAATAGLSPPVVMREVEASLRRLATDYIDIYYLHQPDDDTPIEVTWRCLDALLAQGKVRCVGLSNFAAWQVVETVHVSGGQGWVQPTVLQHMYNLIARGPETELFPMARHYDLATCVYNPLAGGLLTGKHRRGEEAAAGSRLAGNEMYRQRYWEPRLRESAHALEEIARAHGRAPVELALRFLLDADDVDVVLLGATKRAQLEQSLTAVAAAPLSEEEHRACDRVWNDLRGPIPKYNR